MKEASLPHGGLSLLILETGVLGEAVIPSVVSRAAGPEPGHLSGLVWSASEQRSAYGWCGGRPCPADLQQLWAGGKGLAEVDTQARIWHSLCQGGPGKVLDGPSHS